MQKNHVGDSAAIVDGRIVAFGKNSLEAEKEAMKKGFNSEEVMMTYIMGDKTYAYSRRFREYVNNWLRSWLAKSAASL